MTKSETLSNLKAYLNGDTAIGNIIPLRSVLESAIKFLEPSLPSDLDEAANNYGVDIRLGYPRVMDETDRYIYNAFKAGAEWMAGQGYVDTHAVINEYENWGDGFAKLELGINEDDDFFEDWQEQNEIIVQIRKKQ